MHDGVEGEFQEQTHCCHVMMVAGYAQQSTTHHIESEISCTKNSFRFILYQKKKKNDEVGPLNMLYIKKQSFEMLRREARPSNCPKCGVSLRRQEHTLSINK